MIAVKMIATDLKRVGDIARNIAKSAFRLSRFAEAPVPLVIVRLARSAQRMLHGALDAVSQEDAELALVVLAQHEEVDRQQDEAVRWFRAAARFNPAWTIDKKLASPRKGPKLVAEATARASLQNDAATLAADVLAFRDTF